MTDTARVQMLDISEFGATIADHPINGVDLRLVDEWSHCGVTTAEDVAAATQRLVAAAVDAEDEGHPAGTLFWARAMFLREDGVETIHVHAEESVNGCGWVVYVPTVIDDEGAIDV